MELYIKIKEINYGDVAVKVMPVLGQTAGKYPGAVGMTMCAMAALPQEIVRSVFEAIPAEQKNGIVAAVAMEHKEKLLKTMNDLSLKHQIGVTVGDYLMNPGLEMAVKVAHIDYPCIANLFLTAIRTKLLAMPGLPTWMRPIVRDASAESILGYLDRFLGEKKDGFVVNLINQNQHTLQKVMEDAAGKQGIRLTIAGIHAAL